jgi:hypothetical protein
VNSVAGLLHAFLRRRSIAVRLSRGVSQRAKRITLKLILALTALGCVDCVTAGGQQQTRNLKNRYENIEVTGFDVKQGIDFPNDYMQRMMAGVVKDLRATKKFNRVFAEGETGQDGSSSTIQLVGTVTKYKRGNRAKRFIALGLAGETKVVAHVKFIDKATGELLVEGDVDGLVYDGILGGNSQGAPSGVGKDVAKIAKKVFF